MFIFNSPTTVVVILLYVDDIVLTGNNSSFIASLISKLSEIFAMKDLGELHYFLGIEANLTTSPDSAILTQTRYTLDILTKTNMLDSKPCSTPVTTDKRASALDGVFLSDPLQYRSLVGALQYFTLTRPDITYAVNYVSQFMQAPRDTHMLLVKHILRYLKGTIGEGIILFAGDVSYIHGYSESDWADCPDTRRSTSGYCIFLGSSLISWASKKQPTVAKSSIEAEYKAISLLSSKVMWLSQLLNELGIAPIKPFYLYCDNLGARYLVNNLFSRQN
ncbi:uncharacterized protein LOC113335251 [Papaver somniferum]|uniref:uncharacterized protein LOC113335251 n=1 Tax=Papaver somniferum TaxID=3469 RepID=UPI000E7006FC|nr:uncharacterized protein LOC113335251 [Papaver somniferum]